MESFNARLRDELLNGEIFYSLKEAQVIIEWWRHHDITFARIHRWDTGHQRQKA